ncbi:MAG: GTPase ObgE [Pirellulaceae bacterium]|nr:GTPase ObgE [Planctomycetales bacterium]
MFVDRVQIDVQGGKGGDGCCSFLRLRYVPRGGPDGGDGGRGGSIVIVAIEGVDSLAAVAHRKHWKARSGKHGEGANRHGRAAEDLVIQVPPGTVVIDSEHDLVLRDLKDAGDQVIAAKGGRGGKGNAHFKTSTNRAPREFTRGEPGEERRLVLELKVIADAGLIGMPNAGKSTLLSRLTRARPEIADYPFTTKHPNLGRVQIDFDRTFVLADIPGLIEGAHEGVGLGHEFLRHVQRAGVLIHLVEPMPIDGSDPVYNYRAIRDELVQFDPALAERPEILVVSKAELPVAEDVQQQIAAATGIQPMLISAVTGQGLNQLTTTIYQQLQSRNSEV